MLISILKTMFTSPGTIPDDKEWDIQSESLNDALSEDEQRLKPAAKKED